MIPYPWDIVIAISTVGGALAFTFGFSAGQWWADREWRRIRAREQGEQSCDVDDGDPANWWKHAA